MAIEPLAYASQLWSNIRDGNTQEAVRDLAQKLVALASNVPAVSSAVAVSPQFRAFRTAALTVTGTAPTQITLDTTDFDTAGEYSTSTGLWTPQTSGTYLISGGALVFSNQNPNAALRLMVFKNGSLERYLYYDAAASASLSPLMSGADHFSVTAGDQYALYVGLQPAAGSTVILTGSTSTWFSATLQP